MKHRLTVAIASLALGSLGLSGQVLAHGTGHGMKMDAQMKKLHAMMPMFSEASAQLETALEKGDAAMAAVEAGKIRAAIPDLKKSKPHRNVKQSKKFQQQATNLEKALVATEDLAKKDDFPGARAAFKKVEDACSACHAKFR